MNELKLQKKKKTCRSTCRSIININLNTNNSIDFIINEYSRLFPEKPKIRSNNKSIPKRIKTRLGNKDFVDNWQRALTRASKSLTLQEESWFDLGFFVKNDDNYQKCLDGWMDWKDQQRTNNQPGQPKETALDRRKRKLENGN